MNLANLILLFVFFANLFFCLLVYFKNKKSLINRFLALWIFGVAGWSFSVLLFRLMQSLFWARRSFDFVIISVIGLVLFSFYFPYIEKKKKIISLLLLTSSILFIISFLGFIVRDIEVHNGDIEALYTFGHKLFFVWLVSFLFLAFYNLGKKYKKSSGLAKMQLRYIFWGFLLFIIPAVTTNLILTTLGIYQFNKFGPAFSVILMSSMSYAIVKYRLLDIRFVIQRTLIYSLLLAILFGIYGILIFFLGKFVLIEATPLVSAGITTLIICFGFQPLKNFFQKITNPIFFKAPYDPIEIIRELSMTLRGEINLEQLLDSIVSTISKNLGVKKIVFLLLDEEKNNFALADGAMGLEETFFLEKNNLLIKNLEKNKEIIVLEELERETEDGFKKEDGITGIMKKFGIALAIPLLLKGKLISLLILDKKISGEMYTSRDIAVLKILADQAALAIDNALLYQGLEKKVRERTKELEEMNKYLKELSEAKSEFVSIASHQLRSPLTAIKGILSMAISRDLGKLTKNQKIYLEKAYQSSEKLIKLINDLLNVSRIEMGEEYLNLKEVQIEELIESVIKEFAEEAKKKNLSLSFLKPSQPFPKIRLDPQQIRQVLINLMENAIKFTFQGGIIVTIHQENGKIKIGVEDMGVGISEEELPKLFQKFMPKKDEVYITTGLGLYIVRKIVEAHQGKVWAESKGEGESSRFSFTLPIR